MSFHIDNTSRKSVKVTTKNVALELESTKVNKDHNEAT